MKIGVLMKQVPDSDTRIKIKADGSGIETADIKYVVNPYDEYAVEEALKLQAQLKGEVVVFTFGPKSAEERMRTALAMGADRGVRVDDAGLEGADSVTVARVLAAAVKAEDVGILFTGKQAIDDDASQVPQLVAELLDWPQVTMAVKFQAADEASATVHRAVGGGTVEVVKTSLPAVITADKGLNNPRATSLPGIMKARKKPLDVKTADALGVGAMAQAVKITRWSPPPARAAGKVLKGDLGQVIPELVRMLHEEAKVI